MRKLFLLGMLVVVPFVFAVQYSGTDVEEMQKEEKTTHQDITMEKEMWDVILERRQSPTLPIPKWDLKIWQKEEIQFSMWKDRRL